MSWRARLRADPLGWLLGEDAPAVRAATLQRLLDRPVDAPEVRAARAKAMTVDPIRSILAAQDPAGWWAKPGPGYVSPPSASLVELTVEAAMTGGQTLPAPVEMGPQARQTFELDKPLRDARDEFEKCYFEFHLAKEGGSMTRVAEKTGLERTHLYRKLKQLGVDLSRGKRSAA